MSFPGEDLGGSPEHIMSGRLNMATHRLTDLPGEKHPRVCQKCGGSNRPDAGNGLMRLSLDRWQECDHNDHREARVIVLCNKCSAAIIEPHPRLYHRLQPNDPFPGCMDLCVDCKLRSGVSCTAPEAKANGGPGVMITIQKPFGAMVDGKNYRGPMTLWPAPATACRQKQV
jgi:hypothetical protein